MAKRFLECSFDQPYLLPPSLQDWLPENHLARFIAEVADELNLSAIYSAYERKDGRGLAAYHPLMMTRVLLYAYAIGMQSSRAIEKATYDDLAVRYLSADQHPDHDTIAHFRQQHLTALAALFAQALQLCRQAGLVKLGIVALDGTKVRAQASDRKSMRLKALREEEQRLQKNVELLLRQAAEVDAEEDARWGKGQPADPLPAGLNRAHERLKRIREAKQVLEAEARQALTEAEAACPPSKPGRPPQGTPPSATVAEKERLKKALQRARRTAAGETRHYNFTDPDSRMMRDGATGHVIQAYNAQIAIDTHSQIIVAAGVTQEENDKQQLVPMASAVQAAVNGLPEHVVADTGYWSYSQMMNPILAATHLLVPPDRQRGRKNSHLRPDHPMVQSMRSQMATPAGRALYKSRQTVEPVFAHIKEHRWFRRFSFRGLRKVQAEWSLVCLTHNLLKLFRSRQTAAAL